jgi:uncharacterized protein YukE
MALVGADLEQLENLVNQLSGPMSQQLDGVLTQMNNQVQASSAYWVGQNGDKFRSDFANFSQKAKSQLQQILTEASSATGKQAQAIAAATGNSI